VPTELVIAPALGHGLLATQGGIGASPGYDAIDLRRMIQGLQGDRQGVLDAGGWKVSERAAGPAMAVDVAAQIGLARVDGASVAQQGGYVIAPHAAKIALDVPASNATNPRVDSVYLTVRDGAHDGSGFTDARVVVLAGAPSAGATLDNRTGAPSAPTSSVRLADVLVAANASSVTNGMIRDYRDYGGDGIIGEIRALTAGNIPAGWTEADGRAVNRGVANRLFAQITTTAGAGDGSTTFNLPDGRDRMLAGASATIAAGQRGGAKTHTLSKGELAGHDHGGGDHSHPTWVNNGTDLGNNEIQGSLGTQRAGHGSVPSESAHPRGVQASGAIIPSDGGGQAHNNMPPYLGVRHIVFTASLAV
jgi:microcystin-dependent protein